MVAVIQEKRAPTKAEFHEAIATRSPRWYAACLRITHNPDMAQDAVQDALLSAWNKRHQFESTARLDTWIHRIAINAALQLLRKNRPERSEPLDFEIQDEGVTPEAAVADAELESSLDDSLRRLTEIERVCFVLKHLEQWRIREIAEEIGTNDGNIKQALFRGVRKLRRSMTDLRSQHHE
jgi:RNA polymerase sigma-70 factor (ECF subfamily)